MLPDRRQASGRSARSLQEPASYAVAIVRTDSGLLAVEQPDPQVSERAVFVSTVTRFDKTRSNVEVTGELDLATAPFVTEVLNREFASGRHDLVIDVSELSYCSCAGLGELVANRERFRASGGRLGVVDREGCVGRLLLLTERVDDSELPVLGSGHVRVLRARGGVTDPSGDDFSGGTGPKSQSPAERRKPSMARRSPRNGLVSIGGDSEDESAAPSPG